MHQSAMDQMSRCIEKYLSKRRHYAVLDFGSMVNKAQRGVGALGHRSLLVDYDCTVTGIDLQEGKNVDYVMPKPYKIPMASNSFDLVVTGQLFEHVPFPFASMLEIARVLRPGGHLFMTVPSRGHQHYIYDLWRYYPDSMRALAAWTELELLEAHTDYPPESRPNGRWDYTSIDGDYRYWGDTLGVFRKPHWRPSLWRVVNRYVTLRRANELGVLESVPAPGPQRQSEALDQR